MKLLAKLYFYLVVCFIGLATRYARKRGRVVHYTHGGRLYMTRYALFGHLTGDGQSRFRKWFPNLYVHQMHAPDLDPSLHDHPWPWALSWILLGGYCEERLHPNGVAGRRLEHYRDPRLVGQVPVTKLARWLRAPAINRLDGRTFHRLAMLADEPTWTLFLAGPGRAKKPWGYIVEGQGYVRHQIRHEDIDGQELREPGPFKIAKGSALELLGLIVGVERRKNCRLFGLLNESDKAFRQRMREVATEIVKPLQGIEFRVMK